MQILNVYKISLLKLSKKVHHLELQLKRFKRHATLTETLQTSDKELAYLQVHRLQSIIAPLISRIEEYRHIRETKSSESSIHEKELDQLRETYKSQESELNDLQVTMDDMNEKRELLRNKILVCSEQKRGSLLTIDRLDREKANNFQKIESLKQLKLDFDKEITELEPTIDEQLNKYKSQKEDYVKLELEYKQNIDLLDNAQNEVGVRAKISENRSLYERTESALNDAKLKINELNDQIQLKNKLKKDIESQRDHLNKEKKISNEDLIKTEDAFKKIKEDLEGFKNDHNSIIEEKHSVSALINSLKRQRDFYAELVESREGFPEGTRYVLENSKKFPGILGTVADMFQVDEKFRDALESSLGELSHCLIAKDKDSAKMALQQANKDQAGDLTIIPLKEASSLKISLDELPSNSSIQARASELVKTSKQLQPLADYLLGETLVVDDLSSIADSTDLVGWNLVDIAGAYSGQNLIMKNRKVTDDRYIIGRQEKLELITSEIDTLNNKEEQLITRSKELFKIIADAKGQLETQNIKLENNRQSVADIEMDIVRNQIALIRVMNRSNQQKKTCRI